MPHLKSVIKAVVRVSRITLIICLAVLLPSLPLPDQVQAAAGDLDLTFGIGGKVVTDFSDSFDPVSDEVITDIAVQQDGKIVVVGYSYNSKNNDFALARYNSDGISDATFGSGGKVTTCFFSTDNSDYAYGVAIQPDGKIVAVGYTYLSTFAVDL